MSNDSLPPYPAYKSTPIPWLQQVPEHWEVLPNRALFMEVKEAGKPEDEMLSVTIGRGVLKQSEHLATTTKKDSSRKDKSTYKRVAEGDIVYNKMRAWQGAFGRSSFKGIVSPAYVVERPTEKASSAYYHYLFRTPLFAKEAERNSYGLASDIWNLRPEHFKTILNICPPPAEQQLIVRYLRAVDAKVKRYIRSKRKLIAALQEQKQAIIQRAVTRGLNPNVKLKPSGVEWLGEVPEHWEVSMVKRQYRIDLGKMLNASKGLEHSTYPYLNAANIHWDRIKLEKVNEMTFNAQQRTHYRLVKGDVLVTEGGATVGRTAIWNEELTECYYQNSINRARPTGHMPGRYLLHWMFYVTRSGLIEAASNAATFGHLTKEKLSRLPLLVPPRDEAIAIVEHIDRECSALVEPERRLHAQIAMMQEYRTRLIADVVTGAVDVREAAGKLLEEDQMIGRSDYQMMEEEPLSMAAEGEAEYGEEPGE